MHAALEKVLKNYHLHLVIVRGVLFYWHLSTIWYLVSRLESFCLTSRYKCEFSDMTYWLRYRDLFSFSDGQKRGQPKLLFATSQYLRCPGPVSQPGKINGTEKFLIGRTVGDKRRECGIISHSEGRRGNEGIREKNKSRCARGRAAAAAARATHHR